MKNIPNHVLLFILLVILLAAYCFGGHDQTVRDMMLATFASALAVMRPPVAQISSPDSQPSAPLGGAPAPQGPPQKTP